MTSPYGIERLRVEVPTLEPDPILLHQLVTLSSASAPSSTPSRASSMKVLLAAAGVAVVATTTWAAGAVPGKLFPPRPASHPHTVVPPTAASTAPSPSDRPTATRVPGASRPTSEAPGAHLIHRELLTFGFGGSSSHSYDGVDHARGDHSTSPDGAHGHQGQHGDHSGSDQSMPAGQGWSHGDASTAWGFAHAASGDPGEGDTSKGDPSTSNPGSSDTSTGSTRGGDRSRAGGAGGSDGEQHNPHTVDTEGASPP